MLKHLRANNHVYTCVPYWEMLSRGTDICTRTWYGVNPDVFARIRSK